MNINTYLHDAGRIGDGFPSEKLDCAVRAYAIAYEIPYSEAHALFEKAGRKRGHRTSWAIYDGLGIKFNYYGFSLKHFIIDHPKGSFYVCKNGHAFVVKNGVVFDDRKISGRVIIKRFFEVK